VERIAALPVNFQARGLVGRGGLADLQDGITKFDLPHPHEVLWSIGVSLAVVWEQEGDITFVSAGADFEI
jgi:hypothetical protein